jgi:endonuclease/exonuclease/phosphatase family metal-dependent hydrolase
VLDAGYVDAYRLLHGPDVGYTFPSWSPPVRLDYFFTPSGFSEHIRSCQIVAHSAAAAASDHLALVAEVDFP